MAVAAALSLAAPLSAAVTAFASVTAQPSTLLSLNTPIRSFAADGRRIAVAVHAGGCPGLLLRDLPSRRTTIVRWTAPRPCRTGFSVGIFGIALAGARALWNEGQVAGDTEVSGRWYTASAGEGRARSLRRYFVSAPGETEHPGPAQSGLGYAGQGTLMVYALPSGLWRVDGARSTRIGAPAKVWAVNRGRIVVERTDHSLALLDRTGRKQLAIPVPPEWTKGGSVVTAALQGSSLAVIRPWNAVDVYSATTGARLHSWPLPARRTPFIERQASVYDGVLAYHVNGGRLWLLRLSDGRERSADAANRGVGWHLGRDGLEWADSTKLAGTVRLLAAAQIAAILA
jgi:hypothetical protein